MLTSLFPLFYVTGEFHRFLTPSRAKKNSQEQTKALGSVKSPRKLGGFLVIAARKRICNAVLTSIRNVKFLKCMFLKCLSFVLYF